ncbi:hypothetical protein GQ53DRAFT_824462 [Thozetella sp. PMI_491]|nr:hypothetical protein GQ53DRAFT_824462 [Thozetella sp. PMI_491]
MFFQAALIWQLSVTVAVAGPILAKDTGTALSISIVDIIEGRMTGYQDHPKFDVYTRWLNESMHGAYVRRNAAAALGNHRYLRSIDCHESYGCLFTSRMAFSDIGDLSVIEQARQATKLHSIDSRDDGPGTSAYDAKHLRTQVHYKTYFFADENNQNLGFEHYFIWNLFCDTLEYSSSGFVLETFNVNHQTSEKVVTTASSTFVWDSEDLVTYYKHQFGTLFWCSLFGEYCCVNTWSVSNWRKVFESDPYDEIPWPNNYQPTRDCQSGSQVSTC